MRLLILGLPRSGTTFAYKVACDLLDRHIYIMEPFNREVVEWSLGSGVVHDTEGPIPSQYSRLHRTVQELILKNSRWIDDWINNDKPTLPFLGGFWMNVLKALFSQPDIVVKDVYLWVRLRAAMSLLNNVKVLLIKRSLDTWLREIRAYYDKRRDAFENPRFKGFVSLFYRYYHGDYVKRTDVEAALAEATDVYQHYVELIDLAWNYPNVEVVEGDGRLSEEAVKQAINKLMAR